MTNCQLYAYLRTAHLKSAKSLLQIFHNELTCVCIAAVSARTHRPSKLADWPAPHPCAWCPASQPAPKVSKLQVTPTTFPAQDAHSALASRIKHSGILYMMPRYLKFKEEGEAISPQPTNPPGEIARICSPCGRWSLCRSAAHVFLNPPGKSGVLQWPPLAKVKDDSAGHRNAGSDLHTFFYSHVQNGE